MDKQLEILNELSSILHFSTEIKYDSAHLEYKFNPDEQWNSFSVWYEKNQQNYSPNDFDKIDFIHGYGLKNVKDSAEACGGFCVINHENDIYSATVIIPVLNP